MYGSLVRHFLSLIVTMFCVCYYSVMITAVTMSEIKLKVRYCVKF
jgi:hypothetical protein